jgi:hypothetical protein
MGVRRDPLQVTSGPGHCTPPPNGCVRYETRIIHGAGALGMIKNSPIGPRYAGAKWAVKYHNGSRTPNATWEKTVRAFLAPPLSTLRAYLRSPRSAG